MDNDNVIDFRKYQLKKYWERLAPDTPEFSIVGGIYGLYLSGSVDVIFRDDELFVRASDDDMRDDIEESLIGIMTSHDTVDNLIDSDD